MTTILRSGLYKTTSVLLPRKPQTASSASCIAKTAMIKVDFFFSSKQLKAIADICQQNETFPQTKCLYFKGMQTTKNTILITGGSSGIGFAIAENFIKAGNEVLICGRRENKLLEAKQKYPQLHTRVCDIGKKSEREDLFQLFQFHCVLS